MKIPFMKPAAVAAGDPVLHPGSHVLVGFTLGGVHVEPSPDVVLVLGSSVTTWGSADVVVR